MVRRTRSLVLRVLSRLLAPGRGEVRALEEALHLQGVLRFVAVIVATIVAPSLVLAYFGVSAIAVEELAAQKEITQLSEDVAGAFWRQVDQEFSTFEDQVRERLEAGRSPLEGARELNPYLLVALRFNADNELVAPFTSEGAARPTVRYLFHPLVRRAVAAEERADVAAAAQLYGQAAREVRDPAIRARAQFDHARTLAASGRDREAQAELGDVAQRYPDVRDPWGFRLGDLAQLTQAELLLETSPDQGVVVLRELVERLLREPWTLGQGAEGAVAKRAISAMEPHSSDPEWAARIRGEIAERSQMLYWTGALREEIERIPTSREGVVPGELRWNQDERGLWASARWGEDTYVFGLDKEALISQLKADARASVRHGSPIESSLFSPDEPLPPSTLAQRSLSPWLADWTVAAVLRDPEAQAAELARQRMQRIAIIVFAISMMGVGAVVSARLISRELDVVRMKTDFAANVSHELRSPITQIRLKAEALLLGLAEEPEEIEDHYQTILRESERLSRLVDNVLDYSAIDRGAKSYVLRPGNIAETVDRAIESIRTTLEVRDMELDVSIPYDLPEVHHDADAITQCVINLVSNAAKYSPEGGWIGILGREVSGGVEIAVSDKGIGIAAHDLRQIFEPFYRSRDSQARKRKGTGIGLTITRYIMEAHGGTVSVQSRPGQGSTFTLRFPLRSPDRI